MDVVRWSTLVARCGSPARARRAVEEGRWWRVLRDAYAPGSVPDGVAARVAALRLVLPPGAALSHRAALWVRGVDVLARDRRTRLELLDVTVPRGLHLERRPGLVPHSADLPDDELCDVEGLLVVGADRAFVDVARADTLIEAVAFGDAVLRSGAATLPRLEAAMDRAAGLRRVRAARLVVPHLEPRSESLMESRFRMRLVLGGLPRPQARFDVYDEAGHAGRSDLYLPGVVLEYDGREERLLEPVFVQERRRQNRLADTGLEIRRFTSHDYYVRQAAGVCAEVWRALRLAEGRDRSHLRAGPDTLRPPRLRPLPTRADATRRTA